MKRTNQKGFTLIELMIVVAIIGILAAVALPAFQDYTTKAKMAEVVTMSSPARTALAAACSEGTLNGTNNTSLGLSTSTSISSTYVFSIEAAGSSATASTITITTKYDGTSFGGTGTKQTVIYTGTCSASGMVWTIPAGTTGGTLDAKYRPKV